MRQTHGLTVHVLRVPPVGIEPMGFQKEIIWHVSTLKTLPVAENYMWQIPLILQSNKILRVHKLISHLMEKSHNDEKIIRECHIQTKVTQMHKNMLHKVII